MTKPPRIFRFVFACWNVFILRGFCLMVPLFVITGCASILNGKYQQVGIYKPKQSVILINGDTATENSLGRYTLYRDRIPKQITISKPGCKDEHIVVMQYKKSPLYVVSWIPFALIFFPPLLDNGPRAFNYDKAIDLDRNMVSLPIKDSLAKEIKLNNVSVKIEPENLKYRRFPTYKSFKKRSGRTRSYYDQDNEKVDIENTLFANLLNVVLKEKGYIDTTRKVFARNFRNNLSVNATITHYTSHNINNFLYWQYGGMTYSDLTIKWEVLDYYKKPVYTTTTNCTSGQFAYLNLDQYNEIIYRSIKDAMEYGLIEFMNNREVIKLLHDQSEEKIEAAFEEIALPTPSAYAVTIGDAIKASVTIKNKDGHGSGFFISNNGYIVTNYHVVSDTTGLRVILNDQSEHSVSLIRSSKIADLALLKTDSLGIPPLRLHPGKTIEIATDIYAVGTPSSEDLSQTISKGIISGIRNLDDGAKLIQTDASINAGNSGGAIVNKEATVLGVVSSKLYGIGIEGVAFGIPAYEIFDRLKLK